MAHIGPEVTEHTRTMVDVLSIATVIGTLVSALPSIAALVSIVWGVIRIYETKTVQDMLKKRKGKSKNAAD